MTSDIEQWTLAIRDTFESGDLKLPSALRIQGNADVAVELPGTATFANMQTDEAAFEAWSLALKLAGASSVTLRWTPIELGNDDERRRRTRHWNRFLYRIHHFSRLHAWFRAEDAGLAADLVAHESEWLLNVPSPRRAPDRLPPFALDGEERDLELNIAFDAAISERFRTKFELQSVDRQLPIGVFADEVKASTAVFTRAKSAVDLWGIGNDPKVLSLFELKNAKNKSAGAISELLFYALVLRDVQQKRIRFSDHGQTNRRGAHPPIEQTERIEARVLAPRIHPLLHGPGNLLVTALNASLAAAKARIQLGLALVEQGGEFRRVDVTGGPDGRSAAA